MRNLKRALSLALASVMLMGMMVVGSSAASFPDVDSNDNIEAIDVLETVEVMIGNEKGEFEPDKPVTRAEMAVVMAKLLNLDYKYYETTCPFNDVPDWAKGWVGACAANGIVSGRGEGVYDPNSTVTAVEAASMMMRALGYFQHGDDYKAGFESATVAQASRINLFSGIDGNARDPMNRNQVAKLALNTLEANMVEFTGDMGIEIPGVGNVGYRSEYTYRTGTEAKYRAISSLGTTTDGTTNQSYVQLGEQLYNGNLKKFTNEETGFGAPATRWSYKNTEIGTYASAENHKFEGEVKSSDMYAAVGKSVAENYEWIVKMDGQTVDSDGEALFVRKDVSDNDKDTLAGTKRGSTTYVYLNNNAHGSYSGTATVCIVNTYAAEVTKVKDGKITLNDMAGKRLEVEAEGYAEDDVVLYTKSTKNGSAWTVQSVLGEAELIEGKASTVRNENRVVVGGETYFYSYRYYDGDDKYTVASVDKDVAFYVDTQGNIIMKSTAAESNDYAYVLDIGDANSKYSDEAEYGATLILTDGTKLRVDVSTDSTKAWTDLVTDANDKLKVLRNGATKSGTWSASATALGVLDNVADQKKAPLKGQVVSYSEDGGVYELTVKTTNAADWSSAADNARAGVLKNDISRIDLSGATNKTPSGTTALYTDKNSAIVLDTDTAADSTSYEAFVGYENVPNTDVLTSSKMVAYVDGVVKAMFLTDADVGGSGDIIFVLGDNGPKLEGTGSNKYYNYSAVVNGEVQTLRVKDGSDAATKLNEVKKNSVGVFFGMTENSSGYVTKLEITIPSDVSVNGKDKAAQTGGDPSLKGLYTAYVGVSSPSSSGLLGFKWVDGKPTVRPAENDEAVIVYYDGSDFDTETALHNGPQDKAWVVTDEGKVVAVFVWETKDDSGEEEELPENSIEEINGVLYISSVDTLTINQIKAIIAEKLGVDVDEVSYDRVAKKATVGNDVYGVEVSKLSSKEQVAGAELIGKIQGIIGTTSETGKEIKIEGNTITTIPGEGAQASSDYVNAAMGQNNTSQATLDLVKFLVTLHENGAKTIKFGADDYTWTGEIANAAGTGKIRCQWIKDDEADKTQSTNSLVTKIVTDLTSQISSATSSATTKVSVTLVVDGKEMNLAIDYTKS